MILFFWCAFIVFFILISHYREPIDKDRCFVVCTTTIIADAVSAIGGDYVKVKTLMGPGIDPHLYHPRESDIMALSLADIIFYNGLHLEGKMADVFAYMRDKKVVCAVAQLIEASDCISSDFENIYDPHLWHDVSLWQRIAKPIANFLIQKDPLHALYYAARAQEYEDKLKDLDEWVQDQISLIPENRRILITAHDAFSYFGKRYGLQVIGLQGLSTDAQITPHDIQKAVYYCIQYDIPALFLESSIPPQSILAVQKAAAAREKKITIAPELFSDSLGDQTTTAHTYCDMIRYNVETIVSALTQ